MIAFGPIPSRRLGNSLGVNNIPPKHCSYSCVYCQVGPTPHPETLRRRFYAPESVVRSVARKTADCWAAGRRIDAVSFVPDGEPTLDARLGLEIRGVKTLGVPVAVFTNGSLLHREEVRTELAAADLVSVKVDSAQESVWRRIDRPPRLLAFEDVIAGVIEFARTYEGTLVTETMLVDGVNDAPESISCLAELLERIAPRTAYLAVPTRPPADPRVRVPGLCVLKRAQAILEEHVANVELLSGERAGSYAPTSQPIDDLLAILAVHPMRMVEVESFLKRADLGHDVLPRLVDEGRVRLVQHRGQTFAVAG